jgi:lysine biosynthesis protein LysW
MSSKSNRSKISKAFTATCPACGSAIHLRKIPRKGQFITCFECDTMLEVVRLAPLQLDWAFESPFENPYEVLDSDEPRQTAHYVEDGYNLNEEWIDDAYYDEYEDD